MTLRRFDLVVPLLTLIISAGMRLGFGQILGVGIVLIAVLLIAATVVPGGRLESFVDRLSFFATPERTAMQRANRRRSPRATIGVSLVMVAFGIIIFLTQR